jgi:release factor glutamine methyltransferase
MNEKTALRSDCQALLASATKALEAADLPRPRWTAEQILANRLSCQPVELYLEAPPVNDSQRIRFEADLAARLNGVPLQYITGLAGFYGRDFVVGPGVFIPRPETEVLVDAVLYVAAHLSGPGGRNRLDVADVGTGSGAIAVTLALERRNLRVAGIDRSLLALWFARCNAVRQGVRVDFLEGDLLSPLAPESLDIIVSNMPYLDAAKAADWPRELAWEPWLALDGGPEQGTEYIKRLITQAPAALKPGGFLILEIGDDQAALVRAAAQKIGFKVERVVHDLAGRDRVLVLKEKTAREKTS